MTLSPPRRFCEDSRSENPLLSPRKRSMRGVQVRKSPVVSTQTPNAWSPGPKIPCCLHANAQCVESRSENPLLSPRKRSMRGFQVRKSPVVSMQMLYAWSPGPKIPCCLHANAQCVELGHQNRLLAPRKCSIYRINALNIRESSN